MTINQTEEQTDYTKIGTPFDRLVEECGELLQAASKVNRFGAKGKYPDHNSFTNIYHVKREWKHVCRAYREYIISKTGIDPNKKE